MIWGSDRIQTGYMTIMGRPTYAKPTYVLTFNGMRMQCTQCTRSALSIPEVMRILSFAMLSLKL